MTAKLPTAPTVLVARTPDRAEDLISRLRAAGIEAVAAPVIERAPVEDPAARDALADARAALTRGAYAWVALTSINALEALLGTPGPRGARAGCGRQLVEPSVVQAAESSTSCRRHPSIRTRWACVGPATRRAVEEHGFVVDLVPSGRMTAAGLVDAFPDASASVSADHSMSAGHSIPADSPAEGGAGRRVLVPLGDLAAATLPDGLRAKGWEPHVVTAYRTVARELPRDVVGHAKSAGYDAVVVASGSAARQVTVQIGAQRVVAIGEPSAKAAREAGHDVAAVAAEPTDDALATAVVHALDLAT